MLKVHKDGVIIVLLCRLILIGLVFFSVKEYSVFSCPEVDIMNTATRIHKFINHNTFFQYQRSNDFLSNINGRFSQINNTKEFIGLTNQEFRRLGMQDAFLVSKQDLIKLTFLNYEFDEEHYEIIENILFGCNYSFGFHEKDQKSAKMHSYNNVEYVVDALEECPLDGRVLINVEHKKHNYVNKGRSLIVSKEGTSNLKKSVFNKNKFPLTYQNIQVVGLGAEFAEILVPQFIQYQRNEVDQVIRSISHAKKLKIDLRNCKGDSLVNIRHLVSYFVPNKSWLGNIVDYPAYTSVHEIKNSLVTLQEYSEIYPKYKIESFDTNEKYYGEVEVYYNENTSSGGMLCVYVLHQILGDKCKLKGPSKEFSLQIPRHFHGESVFEDVALVYPRFTFISRNSRFVSELKLKHTLTGCF